MFGGGASGQPLADTWTYRWEGDPEEACRSGFDLDGDGDIGCADDDCWPVCAPLCPPGASCPATAPACGDGVCDAVEGCRACPDDCGTCASCGDTFCDPGETIATCPGDCTP